MRRLTFIAVILAFLLLGSVVTVKASPSGLSRAQIQQYLKQPGNNVLHAGWEQQYQDKVVQWRGTVYRIDLSEEGTDTMILVKVLPNSYLYDTILMVPREHPLLKSLQPGKPIAFEGVITDAVDNFLLKEVTVMLSKPKPTE